MLSRDGLALSPGLFPQLVLCLQLFVSPLVASRACWAGCCHEMVCLCQLFVSPLVSFCLPTCFLMRLLSRDGLARSALCLPTCFLTRLLGWMLSRDGLARSALCLPTCFLTRLLSWLLSRDGLVSSLSPHVFPFVSPLDSPRACWAGCCHESPHLCPCACWAGCCHEMVWLGQLFVSSLVSSRAGWAGCCHKMVWLGRLFVSPLVSVCLPTCFLMRLLGWMLSRDGLVGLDAVTRWSGSVSSLSPHLFPFVSPLVSSCACWAGCCREMVWLGWMLSRDGLARSALFVSPLVSSRACWAGCCHEMVSLGQLFVSPLVSFCLPAGFPTRLLGWMLSRDGLARSALCLPTCHEMVWLGQPFVSPLVSSRACWA